MEIILQGLEEGVGCEKLLNSQPVSQVGERQRDFEVGGNFPEDFQLLDFSLAHLGFHLEQEFPQPKQIIVIFAVFPDFVLQKVKLVLSGQGVVRDDFAHGGRTFTLQNDLRVGPGCGRRAPVGKIIIQPCRFKAKRLISSDMKSTEIPDFAKMGGLVPAIVQEAASGEVLMLAFMNEAAWVETLKTGEAHYFSRSRNKLLCTRAAPPATCSGSRRSTSIATMIRSS